MASDYEKFQQQIFDQIYDLEQAAKQSEQKETMRHFLGDYQNLRRGWRACRDKHESRS